MHRSTKEGRAFFLTVMVFAAPMKLPGLVTVAVIFVPAFSFFLVHCLRLTVPNAFFFVKLEPPGHFLPFGALQLTFSVEPIGIALICRSVKIVNFFVDLLKANGIPMMIRSAPVPAIPPPPPPVEPPPVDPPPVEPPPPPPPVGARSGQPSSLTSVAPRGV